MNTKISDEEKRIRKAMLDDLIDWINNGQIHSLEQLLRIAKNARTDLTD